MTKKEFLKVLTHAIDGEYDVEDYIVDEKRSEISVFFEDESHFVVRFEQEQ